jgi:hypothetical protein
MLSLLTSLVSTHLVLPPWVLHRKASNHLVLARICNHRFNRYYTSPSDPHTPSLSPTLLISIPSLPIPANTILLSLVLHLCISRRPQLLAALHPHPSQLLLNLLFPLLPLLNFRQPLPQLRKLLLYR